MNDDHNSHNDQDHNFHNDDRRLEMQTRLKPQKYVFFLFFCFFTLLIILLQINLLCDDITMYHDDERPHPHVQIAIKTRETRAARRRMMATMGGTWGWAVMRQTGPNDASDVSFGPKVRIFFFFFVFYSL